MSNSSYTRESVAVLFSGVLPSHAGAVGWDAHPSDAIPTLAEVLRGAGYQTAFLDLTTMLTHESFARGFDQVEHLTRQWGLSRAGPQLSKRALDLIARLDPRRPFFVYLHYLDPHGPYDPPDDALERLGGDPRAKSLDVYRDIRPHLPEMRREGFSAASPAFADVVRRYDAEVFDTDRAVGQLLEGLRQRGALERTLVVVTSDHGEEFLEHDFVEHAWTLYEESIRVPLIFWAPSHLSSTRVAAPVSTVDIYPTILGLLDVKLSATGLDGQSLFASSGDRRLPADVGDREQISELLIAKRNVVRAVRKDRWKYLSVLRWLDLDKRPAAAAIEDADRAGVPPIDLWAPAIGEELYDLASDSGETNNLVASEPEVAQRMSQALSAYRSRSTISAEPARTLTEAEAERMRALGY